MTDEIITKNGSRFKILREPRAVAKADGRRRWAVVKGARSPNPTDAPVTRGQAKAEILRELRRMPAADRRRLEKALAAGESIFTPGVSPHDEAIERQAEEAADAYLSGLDEATRRAVERYRALAEAGTEQGPEARSALVQSSSPSGRARIERRDIAHYASRDTGGETVGLLVERSDGSEDRHGGSELGLDERGVEKGRKRGIFDSVFSQDAWTGTRYDRSR